MILYLLEMHTIKGMAVLTLKSNQVALAQRNATSPIQYRRMFVADGLFFPLCEGSPALAQ